MSKSPFASDPIWLAKAFGKPGATIKSVATLAGCDEKTVRRWQARHGIASRPVGETASLRQAQDVDLPPSTIEVIEGELLGDGNLTSRAPRSGTVRYSAMYAHNAKHREYLEWLASKLDGIESKFYGPYDHGHGIAWSLRTLRYATLLPIYLRWYDENRPPRNRKIVPTDLQITPRMALHWYLGDGTLAVDRRSVGTKPIVRLSTDGFRLEDVERLAAQLTNFRPRIGRFGSGHRIVLDSKPFLEWIGPCPLPEVHGHKWRPRP